MYDEAYEKIPTWETRREDDVLDPCCDPVFKSMFTNNSDEARTALKGFLSAIFNRKVKKIRLTPTELAKEAVSDKDSFFDVSCLFDGENEYVEIEMQGRNDDDAFDRRAEYYAAHLLNHNTKKGGLWQEVPTVYQISVLNFIYDKSDSGGFSWYLMRKKNGGVLAERLNVIFIELKKMIPPQIMELLELQLKLIKNEDSIDNNSIELEKLNRELKARINKLTALEKWCIFLSYRSNSQLQNLVKLVTLEEESIMDADVVLSEISQDELEWRRQRAYYDNISRIASAEDYARRCGIAKGLEEGRAEGRQQGLQEGRAEGRQQGLHLKAVETAINFLKMKVLSCEQIAQGTGLSLEEVQELAAKVETSA